MRENRERPVETFPEYGDFKQQDKVSFVYNGINDKGELKCFKKYLDTGEIVAVVCSIEGSNFHSDIEIDVTGLQLKFRAGKLFKAGKISSK